VQFFNAPGSSVALAKGWGWSRAGRRNSAKRKRAFTPRHYRPRWKIWPPGRPSRVQENATTLPGDWPWMRGRLV